MFQWLCQVINIAHLWKPCCNNSRIKFNLSKQNASFSYGNAMIFEIITYIHRRVFPEIGKRMQEFLQKVVAYMEEWCPSCKTILRLMFAWLCSFMNSCLFKMHIFWCYPHIFETSHTFCKGLLHWGMVFFMQNHFTSAVCMWFSFVCRGHIA